MHMEAGSTAPSENRYSELADPNLHLFGVDASQSHCAGWSLFLLFFSGRQKATQNKGHS